MAVPGALIGRFPADPFAVDADTLLESAFALAVDDSSIFVLDVMAAKVWSLDRDGRAIAVMGGKGGGPGELAGPLAIQAGPEGDLWVADPPASRLVRFARDGAHLTDVRTPHPVLNFNVLSGGRAVIPTLEAFTLLGTLSASADPTSLAVDADRVPARLRAGPLDRVPLRVLGIERLATDTLFLFRNRSGTDFAAWTAALSPDADRIVDLEPLPLPEWLFRMIEEEEAALRRRWPEALQDGDSFVPFKSVRVSGGTVWLAPAPSGRALAVALGRAPGDSVTVVVPGGVEAEGLLDAAVLGDRLVTLYQNEVRIYQLKRGDPDLFEPPS